MKRLRQALKRPEFITMCVYAAWLVFTAAMWGTERMRPNRVLSGFSLIFAAVIYTLLCIAARLPQLRLTSPALTQVQAARTVRARLQWLSVLKLIFTCGFCGVSVSVLFSGGLRVIVAMFFMLSLLTVTLRFLLQCRAIAASQSPDKSESGN